MQKWVQMGYYWVIGFNPLGFGLGFGSETPTQNGFCRSLLQDNPAKGREFPITLCLGPP